MHLNSTDIPTPNWRQTKGFLAIWSGFSLCLVWCWIHWRDWSTDINAVHVHYKAFVHIIIIKKNLSLILTIQTAITIRYCAIEILGFNADSVLLLQSIFALCALVTAVSCACFAAVVTQLTRVDEGDISPIVLEIAGWTVVHASPFKQVLEWRAYSIEQIISFWWQWAGKKNEYVHVKLYACATVYVRIPL